MCAERGPGLAPEPRQSPETVSRVVNTPSGASTEVIIARSSRWRRAENSDQGRVFTTARTAESSPSRSSCGSSPASRRAISIAGSRSRSRAASRGSASTARIRARPANRSASAAVTGPVPAPRSTITGAPSAGTVAASRRAHCAGVGASAPMARGVRNWADQRASTSRVFTKGNRTAEPMARPAQFPVSRSNAVTSASAT